MHWQTISSLLDRSKIDEVGFTMNARFNRSKIDEVGFTRTQKERMQFLSFILSFVVLLFVPCLKGPDFICSSRNLRSPNQTHQI
jgi:hypothetical protein